MARKTNPESVVRDIRRKTRRKYSTEEMIRIVLEAPPRKAVQTPVATVQIFRERGALELGGVL